LLALYPNNSSESPSRGTFSAENHSPSYRERFG
jgi:hypothetical protein